MVADGDVTGGGRFGGAAVAPGGVGALRCGLQGGLGGRRRGCGNVCL